MPNAAPASAPTMPSRLDSIRKIRRMIDDRAPKHFMVPISRNRSVTDMSMALVIQITVTNKEMVIIHPDRNRC